MSKVYLIGGAPRVGKTSVAIKAIAQRPMLAASTDAIRFVLRKALTAEQLPALFTIHEHAVDDTDMSVYLNQQLDDVLRDQKAETIAVWQSVKHYIQSNWEDGRDVLVEGIHLLPEFMSQLEDLDYSVVFMGNQSPEHEAQIRQHATDNADDWLHGHSDAVIAGWANFTRAYSTYIEQEAKRFDMPYVEVSDAGHEATLSSCLGYLFS